MQNTLLFVLYLNRYIIGSWANILIAASGLRLSRLIFLAVAEIMTGEPRLLSLFYSEDSYLYEDRLAVKKFRG
jgi:hypothetical protein